MTIEVGKTYRNAAGVKVRVQRVYPVAGPCVLRDGTVVPTGELIAVVSLVGRPKLTTYVQPHTLVEG